jgi:hypothetical protein
MNSDQPQQMLSSFSVLLFVSSVLAQQSVGEIWCNADAPNTSISVAEWTIDAPLSQVVWGDDDGLVLVISEIGSLYRSTDSGRTWAKPTFAAGQPTGVRVVWSVDDDPSLLFALASDYVTLMVSKDKGASFARATPSFHEPTQPAIARLISQPGSRGRVLAAIAWTVQCVDCDADQAAYHPNLYLSLDTGVSWSLVDEYIAPFDIAFSAAGGIDSQLLYATLPNKSGADVTCGGECQLLAVTFDHQDGNVTGSALIFRKLETLQRIVWHGTGSAENDETVIAVERTADDGSGRVLSLSHDKGRSWITASIPIVAAPNETLNYGVVASDSKIGDIITVSQGGDAPTATLLTSRAPRSSQFVVALKHVRAQSLASLISRADVETSEDLQGVLFANAYPSNPDGMANLECLQSRVSHSYGSAWQPLRLSTSYCVAQNIPDSDCFLQAFGQVVSDARIGRIYTTAGGHGVWFAIGHAGQCLDENRQVERTQLWVSSDAGDTWTEWGPGQQTYEISGLGTRLIIADTSNATTSVFRYSLDYGATFEQCQLSASNFTVQNVITRVVGGVRDSATNHFLFYGTRAGGAGGASTGVLVAAFFDRLAERNCTGFEEAGSPSSDYYQFMTQKSGDGCTLGRSIVYARKKTSAVCHVPAMATTELSSTPCPCARSDYECDFCFHRNLNNITQCVPLPSAACAPRNGVPAGACGIGELDYAVSSGYQRVPNNQCDDKAAGALTFPVAAPVQCPTVRYCSSLSCGECATSDQCLWCAQSVAGAVLWSSGACVDVENNNGTSYCEQPGVFAAYSSYVCDAPKSTPRPPAPPASLCNSAVRMRANELCVSKCDAYSLGVLLCPCNVTTSVDEDANIVCGNGCTPAALSFCTQRCLSQGADIIACNCDGSLGLRTADPVCKDINGPDNVPLERKEARALPGDGAFAIIFFVAFIVFLCALLISYRLSKRGGGRNHGFGQA